MLLRSLAFLSLLLLASCVPTTPEARIEQSPEKFWKLSDKDQALVRQGQIRRGMSPDAVYYAWGKPSREFVGADENTSTLRWDYTGSTPVYSSNFYGGAYGGYYGRGYYGRRYPGYGYGVGQQVTYIPYEKASVWFRDNQVTKWESAR
ncbi:hypothetical protein ACFQY0_17195 [Haloferula chungangensis]|uniref:Lipoprotein n=1 Tax=Haloferula chungangensis TaxID=1048331 RepID=A0ABW2LBQ3_9BACT